MLQKRVQYRSNFSVKVSFDFIHSISNSFNTHMRTVNMVSHIRLIIYNQNGAFFVQLNRMTKEARGVEKVDHVKFSKQSKQKFFHDQDNVLLQLDAGDTIAVRYRTFQNTAHDGH